MLQVSVHHRDIARLACQHRFNARPGKTAPANPWGGSTLEWQCSSPPPYYNFHKAPVVSAGPYDGYENLMYDEAIGGYIPRKTSSSS